MQFSFLTLLLYLLPFSSEPWILEFVDFGNEKRRDTWLAILKEIHTAYWFISEYGPKENDPSLNYMDGSKQGRKRTITSASNSIARLQVSLLYS